MHSTGEGKRRFRAQGHLRPCCQRPLHVHLRGSRAPLWRSAYLDDLCPEAQNLHEARAAKYEAKKQDGRNGVVCIGASSQALVSEYEDDVMEVKFAKDSPPADHPG